MRYLHLAQYTYFISMVLSHLSLPPILLHKFENYQDCKANNLKTLHKYSETSSIIFRANHENWGEGNTFA